MMNDRMDDRLKLSASRAKAAWSSRPAAVPMGGPAGKLPPRPWSWKPPYLGP
ncbi:hypothetical protein MUN84_02600 [Hymenobacter sp. 5516J-16]|uniref:hypothetical protein n=1 Tax=Hymenobacter sp. 5516J-16 TaxID=2932253 RepID=UPI001FD2C088|nr:hypothetical protein [Hymenobacter sp. 5516J-16]UOQ77599.1 hypothetical protein MUN84_02600 [Hymenobacter sp. 5516J-16]